MYIIIVGLEMVFVKLDLFNGWLAVTSVDDGWTKFSLSFWKSVAFPAGFGL